MPIGDNFDLQSLLGSGDPQLQQFMTDLFSGNRFRKVSLANRVAAIATANGMDRQRIEFAHTMALRYDQLAEQARSRDLDNNERMELARIQEQLGRMSIDVDRLKVETDKELGMGRIGLERELGLDTNKTNLEIAKLQANAGKWDPRATGAVMAMFGMDPTPFLGAGAAGGGAAGAGPAASGLGGGGAMGTPLGGRMGPQAGAAGPMAAQGMPSRLGGGFQPMPTAFSGSGGNTLGAPLGAGGFGGGNNSTNLRRISKRPDTDFAHAGQFDAATQN